MEERLPRLLVRLGENVQNSIWNFDLQLYSAT